MTRKSSEQAVRIIYGSFIQVNSHFVTLIQWYNGLESGWGPGVWIPGADVALSNSRLAWMKDQFDRHPCRAIRIPPRSLGFVPLHPRKEEIVKALDWSGEDPRCKIQPLSYVNVGVVVTNVTVQSREMIFAMSGKCDYPRSIRAPTYG